MVIFDSLVLILTLYLSIRGSFFLKAYSYAIAFADKHLAGGSVHVIEVPGSIL